jgi:ABC-type transport system involved in cytochrome c biogenesis permease subunit
MNGVPARLAALLALGLAALPLRAQTAPEGNAHPETEVVSRGAESLPPPFGEPAFPSPFDAARKRDFASAADLEPLRGVPVFHNGRVKVLDTLARETVRQVTGRRNYQDVLPREGTSAEKIGYDPLFTLLDVIIDPTYYVDRPLLHVNYLPLRRAFVERAFPDDEARQRKELKLTRISPRLVDQHARALHDAYGMEAGYAEAFGQLDRALSLASQSRANMLLVAPASANQPFAHISTLPESHPVRAAAMALGSAWRAGDATGASAAAADLAAHLREINPDSQPEFRRRLELAYNRSNVFEWGSWLYFLALVALILAFGTGRRWLVAGGVAALTAALSLHALGFAARCIIAERYAIQNQFESMTGLSLFGAIAGMAIMLARRQWLFGAAAAGVGFLILILASQSGIPGVHIEREAAILNTSVLLKYHVTTVLVSYSLITLGMVISLFYLGTHYATRLRRPATDALDPGAVAAVALGRDGPPAGRARTLADLDTAQMTVLQLAFWTLAVGIMLGAWWADHSWGRWWAFDPKETWALATWIIYLIVIHVRLMGVRDKGLVTAWLSLAGFAMMLWTYFGVNLLLPGLHAYA